MPKRNSRKGPKKKLNPEKLRLAVKRSNTLLLTYAVVLFQFTALILLSLKDMPVDYQALALAIALPLVTLILVSVAPRIWPVDQVLLVLALFLASIGIVILKDIARSPLTPQNQAIFFAIGLGAMLICVVFMRALRNWERYVPWAIIGGLAAQAAPLVFGRSAEVEGIRRWISIAGIFTVQPSEFVKILLILVLAASFSNRHRLRSMFPAIAFAALNCGLLLVCRDLGTLMLYFFTTVLMFFAATSNLLLTGAGLGAGAVGAVISYNMFSHVRRRVETWQNPWADAAGGGYQVVQALIAMGTGGLFGMGLGLGLPRYIPLYASDFVFAAIAEEFGVIFALCLLMVYVLIIMRGVSVAMSARTAFHALTCLGVVTMIGLQAFTIVGGVIKLIPLTGVTLPFVSAGGSSLVSCFACIGLLLGVSSINADEEAHDVNRLSLGEEVNV